MLREYSLFGKSVNLDGKLFFIHGVVHETPWVSLSKSYKQSINYALKDKSVICEDGLVDWFDNAQSFNETKYFGFDKLSFKDYLQIIKRELFSKSRKNVPEPEIIQKVKSLENLRDLRNIREELLKTYPLEPQGMNDMLLSSCGGNLYYPGGGNLPNRIKRYLYEAKQSIEYMDKKILTNYI